MNVGRLKNGLASSFALFALAAGQTLCAEPSAADLEPLFSRIVQSVPEPARYPEVFVEAPELWSKSEDFKKIEAITKASWRGILDKIGTLAPTGLDQEIFFRSAHSLSRDEYAAFLNRSADLVQSGSIQDRRLLMWNVFPEESHLKDLISKDYKNPDVKQFLLKYRKIFSDTPYQVKFADDALAGRIKSDAEESAEGQSPGPNATASNAPSQQVQTPSQTPTPNPQSQATPIKPLENGVPWIAFAAVAIAVIGILVFFRRKQ